MRITVVQKIEKLNIKYIFPSDKGTWNHSRYAMESFTNNSKSVQTKSFQQQQRKQIKSYRSALTCTNGFQKEKVGAMKKSCSTESFENFKGAFNTIKKSVSMDTLDRLKQDPQPKEKRSNVKKSGSVYALSWMLGSMSNIKKSISWDKLNFVEKECATQPSSLDHMKELATNIMKANGPGVAYDIAKDAIQNINTNTCDLSQATNSIQSVQSDIEQIMVNHITQGSIVNTVTHIINHHHM